MGSFSEIQAGADWWGERDGSSSLPAIVIGSSIIKREISIRDFGDRREALRDSDLLREISSQLTSGMVVKGYDAGPPDSSGEDPARPDKPNDFGPDIIRLSLPGVTLEELTVAA